MDLRCPQERMVQLGRQARPSNAFLDLPIRQRVAECNKPLETIAARVERHFGEIGVAEDNAAQELLALVATQSKERETEEKLKESVRKAKKRAVNAVKKLRMERQNCQAQVEVRREKKERARKYSEEVLRRNVSAAVQSKEMGTSKQSENGIISVSSTHSSKVRIIREAPYASSTKAKDPVATCTTLDTSDNEMCRGDAQTVDHSDDKQAHGMETLCSQDGSHSQGRDPASNGSLSDNPYGNCEIDEPGHAPPHPQCSPERPDSLSDESVCVDEQPYPNQDVAQSCGSNDFDNVDAVKSPSCRAANVQTETHQLPSATRLHLKTYDPAHARRLLQSHVRQYRDEPEIGMLGVVPGPSKLQNGCGGATDRIVEGSRQNSATTANDTIGDSGKHTINGWRVVNPFQQERSMPCPSMKGSSHGCQKSTDSLLSNSNVLYMLRQKVADLGVRLPRLCNCHNLSHFDQDYTQHCCMNCPLYRNMHSQERLLKSLLRNYIDL